MKYFVAGFLLSVASPVAAQSDLLYELDVERMLEVAIDAVLEQHPDIHPEDLKIHGGVHVTCNPSGHETLGSAKEFDADRCSGSINFHLDSTSTNYKLVNDEGQCVEGEMSSSVHVVINAVGSTWVSSDGGFGSTERVVECTEEFDELPE